MNRNFTKEYVDLSGNKYTRKKANKNLVVIFASIKFFTDRLLALLGLIIFSPIMLLISIIIKIDSKGPVLFKQIRTGKGGKNITVCKFRTMVEHNDVRDFSKEDEHTKVGTFLRKTSLDELPQLVSILKGDMSFIGPRPWIPEYYDNMTEIQRHRCDVRPGITGLAQVNGRNTIDIFEKIEYDLKYIKNYSLRQDIKIIFLTIKTVLSGKGSDAGKEIIHNEIEELQITNKKRAGKELKHNIEKDIEVEEEVIKDKEVQLV